MQIIISNNIQIEHKTHNAIRIFPKNNLGKCNKKQATNKTTEKVNKKTLLCPIAEPKINKTKQRLEAKLAAIDAQNEEIRTQQQAATLMRKYLDSKNNRSESWLISTIREISVSEENELISPSFCFENTKEAAKWNAEVLKAYENDFSLAIENQQNTVLQPGSEFQAIEKLKNLWKYRENWNHIEESITKGCVYPLKKEQSNEKVRLADLEAMIQRGNHKSALRPCAEITFEKDINRECRQGYMIPVPIKYLRRIKNAGVIPVGVHDQWTINEQGERIPKKRTCHDASFPGPSGYSVNLDHDEQLLTACLYGYCLKRVIHTIHRQRRSFPETAIYLFKYDFEAAYRRMHVTPKHAVLTIIIFKALAYILTRLPFGTKCGPSKYSDFSEAVFDTANDVINDPTWDPDSLHSPIKPLLQPPDVTDARVPFTKAKDLAVDIPLREIVYDGYIDDSITAAVDNNDNLQRAQNAIPLVTHVTFRPLAKSETVERDDAISHRKLEGDGTPSEKKIILGWLLDTRAFRIFLPADKAVFWNSEIDRMLANAYKIKSKEMESTVGRLNHVGYIMPHGRYFLNRLRKLQRRCEKYGPQKPSIPERKDLLLWKEMITNASQTGISLNQISFVKADTTIYTDASGRGLGGYNPQTGIAWRYNLPEWMARSFHINTLEFMASLIGIWIEIKQNKTEYLRILNLTDNSSAVGWLFKSNFDPDFQQLHDEIARQLARLLLENETTLYPQHIPGEENIIADSLSRDFHLSPKVLASSLQSLFPTQAPKGLKISEKLPAEIISWVESLRGLQINKMGSLPAPAPSKTGASLDGSDSLRAAVSRTNFLIRSASKPESQQCPHLRPLYAEMNKARQDDLNSQVRQLKVPYTMYVRFFEQTFVGPQSLKRMDQHHLASKDNGTDT